MILLAILAPCTIAQVASKPALSKASRAQAPGSLSDGAKFTDVTSTVNINFEYVASHTSKKYLIETMGSGVALFDYDNDGRLDVFVVNAAPLSDPTPK
ncbi:MAG: VCBS repeat-containing protein, partial [Candidatus Acidiferrum sp.]